MKHKCQHCCNHKNVECCKLTGNIICKDCGKQWFKEKQTTFSPIWVIPYQRYIPQPEPMRPYPDWEITWGGTADNTNDYQPLLTSDPTEIF